ncbi:AAA family ATPase [Roseofilum reptotaenium CS-1145]|uniref:ATPase n=1 Tax=Roseofilum reptotaenium AO1-A TaxID=1925591 RepID=A0A1L9QUX6_9CYAN|nr:AAA family ATPase [Roseofilum reptotaenium]MDB9516357.1 AAA family ATPase [Roseofilum reptotaenium CS-1145]OJJ26436.1 ATPase [Roseofilum reptotaenium AO1-A]
MFKEITVSNFRCFKDITIPNLERVNLIGGVNNVGKTTLLEAIALSTSLNSLETPLRLNFDRGIVRHPNFNIEEICEWLFYEKRSDRNIKIKIVDHTNINFDLKLSLDKASTPRILPLSLRSNTRKFFKDLKLEFKQNDRHVIFTIFLTLDKEDIGEMRLGIEQETIPEEAQIDFLDASYFISSRLKISPSEDAEKFSDLEAMNRQQEIVDILRILEPRLNRLAILVNEGIPMIYGDVGMDSLIPISVMGEGMGRLLSIILSIMSISDGILLIDEIDNGIHYSVLEKVWQSIALTTQKYNTQIFATTHSRECIIAAHQAFSQSESYDFRYVRLEREKDSPLIKSLVYDQETLETSVDLNLEMR